jgi:small subunit ribosomal protein S29
MDNLSVQNMANNEFVGQMLGLTGPLLDQLRDSAAFKRSQNWNMFRRPATLIREHTVNMGKTINDLHAATGQNARCLLTGERGSGKSILMLQAMCMAFMQEWLVINIPEGETSSIISDSLRQLTPDSTRADKQHLLLRTPQQIHNR